MIDNQPYCTQLGVIDSNDFENNKSYGDVYEDEMTMMKMQWWRWWWWWWGWCWVRTCVPREAWQGLGSTTTVSVTRGSSANIRLFFLNRFCNQNYHGDRWSFEIATNTFKSKAANEKWMRIDSSTGWQIAPDACLSLPRPDLQLRSKNNPKLLPSDYFFRSQEILKEFIPTKSNPTANFQVEVSA